jgi:thiamine transport system substrate-binding protein
MRHHVGGPAALLLGPALAVSLSVSLAGCSLGTPAAEKGAPGTQVVLATHDSWAVPKSVLAQFTKKTGYTVKVQSMGDAGELTNKLVLTKGSPIADMVYGIDNTFVSRAADEGVLADYTPAREPGRRFDPKEGALAAKVTSVDYSDVCVNVDNSWFDRKGIAPPKSFEDLVRPRYRDLMVSPAPTTSSTGLAFLLATVGRFGDHGWVDYWKRLADNGVEVTSGWSDAYEVDFTAGGGKGDRPIVVSYASSPPFTVPAGATRPTTSALLDTCFRQVEYAGLLAGAANQAGAKAFIDFMVGRSFQAALPEHMYVYPVDADVRLPAQWARWAPTARHPWSVPESAVTAHRDAWLRAWQDVAP